MLWLNGTLPVAAAGVLVAQKSMLSPTQSRTQKNKRGPACEADNYGDANYFRCGAWVSARTALLVGLLSPPSVPLNSKWPPSKDGCMHTSHVNGDTSSPAPRSPAHLLRLHYSASLLTHLFREQHRSQLFLRSAAVWSPPAVTLSIFKNQACGERPPPPLVVPFRLTSIRPRLSSTAPPLHALRARSCVVRVDTRWTARSEDLSSPTAVARNGPGIGTSGALCLYARTGVDDSRFTDTFGRGLVCYLLSHRRTLPSTQKSSLYDVTRAPSSHERYSLFSGYLIGWAKSRQKKKMGLREPNP